MGLRDIRPGLRTIHNGSNAVAKASVVVPEGGDLTVPEVVAEQLLAQGSGAFKDGPAPQSLLDALAARDAAEPDPDADEVPAEPEPEADAPADEPAKAKRAAKKSASKKG